MWLIPSSISVHRGGGNDSDIRRRIELARTCMKSLDRGICRSKLRLYNVYILPVLLGLYGSDTWECVTEASRQRVDAFDQWCLRRILRVPYTAHVTNRIGIGSQTMQPIPGFLTNTTTPPQAVWAYSSSCSLRGPLTCATSIH